MRNRNRHSFFYIGSAAIFAALVLLAFGKRYYLGAFYDSQELPRLVQIHGAVMTGWVVLLIAQSGLVAAHKVKWHRKLGILGAAWAVLVVALGSATTIHAAAREVQGHTDMESLQLTITGLELVQMLLFAAFVATAVLMRSRIDYHKRLMLLTIVCMLPSIIPRLPVDFFQSILSILLAVYVVLAALIAVDAYRERKLHPAFAVGGGLIVTSLQLAFFGVYTPAWHSFLARAIS
jgi:hypothetical protein